MEPLELIPTSKDALFLNLRHDERWEPLRPVIVSLRTGTHSLKDIWTIPRIAKFMKRHYSFTASQDAYSYRFRRWNVSKRVTKFEKEAAIAALSRRPFVGSSTGRITLKQGDCCKKIDSKAIRRHLQGQKQRMDQILLQPGVFSMWTLPYDAYMASIACFLHDVPSPFGTAAQTPPNLEIDNLETTSSDGPSEGSSPTMQLVREKYIQQSTSFLLQGKPLEFLGRCSREDQSSIVNQLHDLHVQCIVMAKYWGRGPLAWSPSMVAALTLGTVTKVAISPTEDFNNQQQACSSHGQQFRIKESDFPTPASLCRWAIHAHGREAPAHEDWSETELDWSETVTEAESQNSESFDVFDTQTPEQWPDWNWPSQPQSFSDAITESIINTPFTSGPSGDPLLSPKVLSMALENDCNFMTAESIRIAIISGNAELLGNIIDESIESNGEEIAELVNAINPFHLAASYLDGGSGCCEIFVVLLQAFDSSLIDIGRDESGYTVLDRMILSVIRSHTTVRPDQVFQQSDAPATFPGEAKDICGRWDADTPEVRALFAAGYARIPATWKHPFCHTAVQAVCHACIAIFAAPFSPDINTTSNIFARICFGCGDKLGLGPLHLTVVTAFYLAERGTPEETLFGILAVAVCLLSLGADSRQLADICVEDFLSGVQDSSCRHTKFSPAALMQAVPSSVVERWTSECQTGWFSLLAVLQLDADDTQLENNNGQAAKNLGVDATSSSELFLDFMDWPDWSGSEKSSPGEVLLEPKNDAPDSCSGCGLCDHSGINVHEEWLDIPCKSAKLGLLWACIQTEFLTYRRLADGDDWVSKNFSMVGLLSWLRGNSESFQTLLVSEDMMEPHTKCGWFHQAAIDFLLPTAMDVSREHFMNLEDFQRMSFLPASDLLDDWVDYYQDPPPTLGT